MSRFFFTLILLLLFRGIVVAQQNCACAEVYANAKEVTNDSTRAIRLIQSSSNKSCIAKGYELLGSWMNNLYKADSAIYFLEKGEKLYLSVVCNDSALIKLYENFAQAYYIKADFVKAQEYSFKMLNSAELAANKFAIAKCNTMIAQLFNQIGQPDKGIVYLRKAVSILPSISDYVQKKFLLFSFAKRYLWHYQDTKVKSSLDSSEMYGQKILALGKSKNDFEVVSKAFSHLQGVAYEYRDFKKALTLLDSSFVYIDKENYEDLRVNYFDKSDLYLELKDYSSAQKFADSTLLYSKLCNNISFTAECYSLIARIAKEKGDYKKAYEFNEMARDINDSIKNVSKSLSITELEKKYNQAKNESLINELAKKKQFYLLLAIIGVMVAVIIAFYLRHQSIKHKKNILETEQRLNRARMNPHFFFNALTSMQKFALGNSDGNALAINLSKFSNIMRETLESTYKDYVTIEQEVDFLTEYLEVQKTRFPNAFIYAINIDASIEPDEMQIPSMILQPFIENSIEHGFNGIDYLGNIQVTFSKKENEMLISIIDNGKGLTTTVNQDTAHISRASQIIKDRIYLLNIKLKTKAGFSINNNKAGNGVVVNIHLPIIYKS